MLDSPKKLKLFLIISITVLVGGVAFTIPNLIHQEKEDLKSTKIVEDCTVESTEVINKRYGDRYVVYTDCVTFYTKSAEQLKETVTGKTYDMTVTTGEGWLVSAEEVEK